MKIWIIDDMPFNNLPDAELYAEVHYSRVWDETQTTNYPSNWQAARNILVSQDVPDLDVAPYILEHDLAVPHDPEEAFGCIYNYADLSKNIDGYDPILHRAALEEWVKSQRNSIEDAMSDTVFTDFPHDIDTLTDPGTYWRWNHQTSDYDIWAAEQRSPK